MSCRCACRHWRRRLCVRHFDIEFAHRRRSRLSHRRRAHRWLDLEFSRLRNSTGRLARLGNASARHERGINFH